MPEPESSRKRSRSPSESDTKQNKRPNTGSDEPPRRSPSPPPSADAPMSSTESKTPPPPDSASAAGDASAAPAPSANIHLRCLIVTQDASIIIGRGGAHVGEIRDKSGAKVVVSESIPGNPERILNVSGPLDAVSKVQLFSLLDIAFGLIVRRINDEPFDVPSVPGSRAVTIKFMIPNSRMGSVIGKGGAKIKEIQEASGARLNASEGMLPGSNERVLSVAGVADAIHIATYYIGNILIEAQERQPSSSSTHSSYRPMPHSSSSTPRNGRGPAPGSYNHSGGQTYIPPYASSGSGYAPPTPTSTGPLQTQQIYIPNDLVGCIIGKGGSKINEIRSLSQSTIKIMEPGAVGVGMNGAPSSGGGGGDERLVVITGASANIQMAVQMLYERLEQEKQKKLAA
ncbi:hypothetical protein DL96DRAFT_1556209 [Flagelloscypha sp. PMI_526]|nr:hypothetical protein DL96DRAFT_1556209 [Flagelloscypha sp. PMI_526]